MNTEILKAFGIVAGGILATVAPYLATWIKSKWNKNEQANSFIHNTEYRVQINEVLVEIRAIVGANRVSIVEYHNGNAAINGLPFNYASMTYEKDDQTTREMMMNFQKVPISPTCELLLDVHSSNQGYVRVGKDYKHKDVIEFNKYYGIESAYIFRIGDHIKYGTVQLMWIGDDITLEPEAVEEVHYKVMYINELMKKMKKH
jgi:hypothetical protein